MYYHDGSNCISSVQKFLSAKYVVKAIVSFKNNMQMHIKEFPWPDNSEGGPGGNTYVPARHPMFSLSLSIIIRL